MALRRRDEIEASEGRDVLRLARRGAGSLLYVLTVVAAVLVLLAVTFRLNATFDLSQRGDNDLSPQTQAVLAGLEEPVKLYALFKKERTTNWENYWNRLRLYRQASSRIDAEMIDPVSRPGIVRQLGLNPEQEGLRLDGTTVVVRGERRVSFRGTEEEDITNAILEASREGDRVVGFLRGYGERDPDSESDAGFGPLAEALRQEYYEVRDVTLAEGIPPDVLVLIAGGLRLPIPQPELERLAAWLADGGRLLALVDGEETSGLNLVLDRWGLRATGLPIVDPRENINRDTRFIKVTDYTKHETVRGFGRNFPTVFPTASRVEHYEVSGDIFHDDLALSSAFSWGIAPDGERTAGPHGIAAAAWRQETVDGREVVARLVLIGDSDFATRAYLPARTNRNLLLNCVGWLSRQEQLISVRRQPLAGQRIELSGSDLPVLYAAVLAAPLVVAGFGLLVFLRRRGR